MSSTWATKPPGTADLTGQRFGSVEVVRVASSQPLKWLVRCTKPYCGTEWAERHEKIVNGAMRCANLGCSLNRLEPTKVSKYETWLNRVEPEKLPEPVAIPVVKQIVQPSPEYQRYRRHAVIKWGYQSGDGRLIEHGDWQQLPEFAKEKMLQIIAKEEK